MLLSPCSTAASASVARCSQAPCPHPSLVAIHWQHCSGCYHQPQAAAGWHQSSNRTHRRCRVAPRASEPASQQEEDASFEGLAPEEDEQVPGAYTEAMNGNTKLGKAIRAACSELKTLNKLELENLLQAEALIKKLGFKVPPIIAQAPAFELDEEEEAELVEAAQEQPQATQ